MKLPRAFFFNPLTTNYTSCRDWDSRRCSETGRGKPDIVALGLKDICKATNPGLRALIEIAGCGDGTGMTAYDKGFRIDHNQAGSYFRVSETIE